MPTAIELKAAHALLELHADGWSPLTTHSLTLHILPTNQWIPPKHRRIANNEIANNEQLLLENGIEFGEFMRNNKSIRR